MWNSSPILQKMVPKVLLSCIFIAVTAATSVDANDALQGNGLFTDPDSTNYTLDSSHSVTFISDNGSNILRLEKPDGKAISYTEGLSYSFSSCSPTHIQFKFASSDPDTEDSNMRIMDSDSKTLILFRAGKGGLIRVNQQQMISFYNSSVSTDSDIKLTQVDLLVDWDAKQISIFVDSTFKANAQFFDSDITETNQVLLYNLYNSVSYWQDIVICTSICYNFNWEKTFAGGLTFLFIALIMFIA